MAKYRDTRKLGHSKMAPYISGEPHQARHERRKRVAIDTKKELQKFAQENAYEFKVTNDDHHFMLKKMKFVAEWWPSSAKLVINKRWEDGIHCYDYKQLIKQIKKYSNKADNQE